MAERADVQITGELVVTNVNDINTILKKNIAEAMNKGIVDGGNRLGEIVRKISGGKIDLVSPEDFRFLNDFGSKLKDISKQGKLVNVFGSGNVGAKDLANGLKAVESGFKDTRAEAARARDVINSFAGRVGFTTTRLASYLIPASLFFQASKGAREFFNTITEGNADIIRLSQILDTSNQNARALADQALNIGKSFGVARKEILSTTVLLAQAGPKFATPIDIQAAQDVLAKSQLGATFGNLGETASGAIAFLSQFNKEGRDLASVLDVANQLSKKFAVESKDLFEAVERGGAAFSAVGGSIEEFQALVTGVSQLTRLSASTIGTSFNTIALRVFRPEVLDFIESIGISTKDSQGNIKGFIDLLRGVADEFTELDKRSKARVVDVLFGVRQGKIGVKLLEDLGLGSGKSIIESSLGETEKAQGSIERDAVKGLQRVDVQLKQLGVSFQEAFLAIGEDPAFQKFLKDSIDLIGLLSSGLKLIAPLLAPLVKFGAIFAAVRTAQLAPDVIRTLSQTGKTSGGLGAVSRAAAGEDIPDGIGSEIASPGQMIATGKFRKVDAEIAQLGIKRKGIISNAFAQFRETEKQQAKQLEELRKGAFNAPFDAELNKLRLEQVLSYEKTKPSDEASRLQQQLLINQREIRIKTADASSSDLTAELFSNQAIGAGTKISNLTSFKALLQNRLNDQLAVFDDEKLSKEVNRSVNATIIRLRQQRGKDSNKLIISNLEKEIQNSINATVDSLSPVKMISLIRGLSGSNPRIGKSASSFDRALDLLQRDKFGIFSAEDIRSSLPQEKVERFDWIQRERAKVEEQARQGYITPERARHALNVVLPNQSQFLKEELTDADKPTLAANYALRTQAGQSDIENARRELLVRARAASSIPELALQGKMIGLIDPSKAQGTEDPSTKAIEQTKARINDTEKRIAALSEEREKNEKAVNRHVINGGEARARIEELQRKNAEIVQKLEAEKVELAKQHAAKARQNLVAQARVVTLQQQAAEKALIDQARIVTLQQRRYQILLGTVATEVKNKAKAAAEYINANAGRVLGGAARVGAPLILPAAADLISSRLFKKEELDFSQNIPDNESILTSLRGNRSSDINRGTLSGISSGASIALLTGATAGVGTLVVAGAALTSRMLSASQATEEMNQQLNAAAASAKKFTDFLRIINLTIDENNISGVSTPTDQFDQQNIFFKVLRSALATATTLNLTEGFRGAEFEDPGIRRQFNQQFDQGGFAGIVFNVEAFLTGLEKVKTALEQLPIQSRIRIENELKRNIGGSVGRLSDADLKDLTPNKLGELSPEGNRKLEFFARNIREQMVNSFVSQGIDPEIARSFVNQFLEGNKAIKDQVQAQDRLKKALNDATSSIPAFLIGLEEIAERQKSIFARNEAGRFSRTSSLGAAISPLTPQLIGPEFMQLFSDQLRGAVRGRNQLPTSSNNFLSGFQQDVDLATISGLSSEFIKPMADQLSRIANSTLAGTEGSNIPEIKALSESLDKRQDPLAKQLASVFRGLLGQNLEKFTGKTPNQIFEELIKTIDPSEAIVNIIGGNIESLNRDIQEFGQLMDATSKVWQKSLDIIRQESDARLGSISRRAGIGFINAQETIDLLNEERNRIGGPNLSGASDGVVSALQLVNQRTNERNAALFPTTGAVGQNDIVNATQKLLLAQNELAKAESNQNTEIQKATQQQRILTDVLSILNRNFNDFVQTRTSLAQTPTGDVRQFQSLNRFVLGGTDIGKVLNQVGNISDLRNIFEKQPELFNKALQQAGFNKGLVERFIKSTSAFGQIPINDQNLPAAQAGTIAAILATLTEGPTGRDPDQMRRFFDMIEQQENASRSIEQINQELIDVQKKVNEVEEKLLKELQGINSFLAGGGQGSLSIAAVGLATKLEELKTALDRSGQKASMEQLSKAMAELTGAFTGSLKVDHAVIIKGLESLPVDDPIVQPVVLALITSLIDHLGVDPSSQKLRDALMKVKGEISTRSGK